MTRILIKMHDGVVAEVLSDKPDVEVIWVDEHGEFPAGPFRIAVHTPADFDHLWAVTQKAADSDV